MAGSSLDVMFQLGGEYEGWKAPGTVPAVNLNGPSAPQVAWGPRDLDRSPSRDPPGLRRGQMVGKEGKTVPLSVRPWDSQNQAAHTDTHVLSTDTLKKHMCTPHTDTHILPMHKYVNADRHMFP